MDEKQPRDDETPMCAITAATDGVTIAQHTVRAARLLAEQAAERVSAKLRDAEQERDQAVRSLWRLQERVDRLTAEREFRVRLMRDLRGHE